MHARDIARQTHELTDVGGDANTCPHLWKFKIWKSVRRAFTGPVLHKEASRYLKDPREVTSLPAGRLPWSRMAAYLHSAHCPARLGLGLSPRAQLTSLNTAHRSGLLPQKPSFWPGTTLVATTEPSAIALPSTSGHLSSAWRVFFFLVIQNSSTVSLKNLPANAGDTSSTPGSGRSPGEENGKALQYSCLENPMDRGAWWDIVPGVTKSWTQLSN